MRGPGQFLTNFHWVAPGAAARSAQPYAGFTRAYLKANGIAALVNLRGRHPEFGWWRRETAICAGLGVAHFDAMLDSRLLPTRAMLVALIDAFEAAPIPLLIKCSGGQDRSSFAAALYLIARGGWGAADLAAAQFARWPYLHFPKPQQRWLAAFVTYAREASGGAPLADWVRNDYAPQALERWLIGHGLSGSYAGIYPALS